MKTSQYLLVAVAMSVSVMFVSHLFQPQITLNGGQGWDGTEYCRVAKCIQLRTPIVAQAPFVYRVGTPLLAASIPQLSLLHAFYLVNIIGNLFLVAALACWFRLWFRNDMVSLGLIAIYVTQWHASIRFAAYYPVFVDPWYLAFNVAGLVLIEFISRGSTYRLSLMLCLACAVGILFRESMLGLVVAAMFVGNPFPREWPITFSTIGVTLQRLFIRRNIVLALCAVISLVTVRLLCKQTNSFNYLDTALSWLVNKPLPLYLHGWIVAYGPLILFLVVYRWRSTIRFLLSKQYLAVALAYCAIFGWLGGSDTERILYWGAPIVLLLAGRSFVELWPLLSRWKIGLLILVTAQLISQRLLWTLPDVPNTSQRMYPIFTIPSSHCRYLDLWSFHGERVVEFVSLAQYGLLLTIMLLWLASLNRRNEMLARNDQDRAKRLEG